MKINIAFSLRKAPSHNILQKEEIVIQRLSPEVSGKAQKYSRIGAREFVPFEHEEVTLHHIKNACKRHFAPVVGERMVCDVLAGEQGPSCTSLEQIPDLKVVHVRFIEPNDGDDRDTVSMTGNRLERGQRKRPFKRANALSLPATKAQSPSKAFPKSLSVLEMMKLGKVVNEKSTERMELFKFDLADMAWSSQPFIAEFSIASEPFGKGGFREAFKATSKTPTFQVQQWVITKYLKSAVDIIKETKQTTQQHTKKVVQMHMLARNFTQKLEQELKQGNNLELYGETLTYHKIYMGRIHGQSSEEEWVTIEEYIDGEFTKYVNNTGIPCRVDSDVRKKCESLAHFSYERSGENLMVVDMQGSGHSLFDPEIASKEMVDGEEVLFSTGNLSLTAINNFIEHHTECNLYCTLLGLKKLSNRNAYTHWVLNSVPID